MGTTLASGVAERCAGGRCRRDAAAVRRCARRATRSRGSELVRRFLPMARSLARRYGAAASPLDDLVQVASLGAREGGRALRPPSAASPFPSYAVPTIVGELKRHLRDTRWAAYVPQRMRERVLEVDRAAESLRRALGRSPTVEEVAA